ncbi:DUF4190 domain-containing protein [Blastococcus sp. SYSU D00669]
MTSGQHGYHPEQPQQPQEDGHPYGAHPYGAQPYGAQPVWGQPSQGPFPPQALPYGYGQGYPVYAPAPPQNGMGIAGFVTGVTGLVLCWIPFLGFLIAGTGIVLSAIGMNQGKQTGASTGLAIAGLVCGIIGAIPGLIVLVAFLSAAPY